MSRITIFTLAFLAFSALSSAGSAPREAPPPEVTPIIRFVRGVPRVVNGGIRPRDFEDARFRRNAPPPRVILSQGSRLTRSIPPRIPAGGIGSSHFENDRFRRNAPPPRVILSQGSRLARSIPPRSPAGTGGIGG